LAQQRLNCSPFVHKEREGPLVEGGESFLPMKVGRPILKILRGKLQPLGGTTCPESGPNAGKGSFFSLELRRGPRKKCFQELLIRHKKKKKKTKRKNKKKINEKKKKQKKKK